MLLVGWHMSVVLDWQKCILVSWSWSIRKEKVVQCQCYFMILLVMKLAYISINQLNDNVHEWVLNVVIVEKSLIRNTHYVDRFICWLFCKESFICLLNVFFYYFCSKKFIVVYFVGWSDSNNYLYVWCKCFRWSSLTLFNFLYW